MRMTTLAMTLSAAAILISGTMVLISATSISVEGYDRRSVSQTRSSPSRALANLDALTVRPEGPMTGYQRELFGQPWRDTDGNGCDQRSDVLTRDAVVTHDARRPCRITSAHLVADPYTGAPVDTAATIEIDHVLPLAAAWRAGAAAWGPQRREQLANDLDNRSKSDETPDTWRPADPAAYCRYATIYITVSRRYELTVSQAIHDSLADLAGSCR